jgi:hypothetical protein
MAVCSVRQRRTARHKLGLACEQACTERVLIRAITGTVTFAVWSVADSRR